MSDEKRIAEISARVDAATPGPWVTEFNFQPAGTWITNGAPIGGHIASVLDDAHLLDAALIANAPADLAYLLAENARLRERVAALEGAGQMVVRAYDCDHQSMCDCMYDAMPELRAALAGQEQAP